jgi:hypothetical protein
LTDVLARGTCAPELEVDQAVVLVEQVVRTDFDARVPSIVASTRFLQMPMQAFWYCFFSSINSLSENMDIMTCCGSERTAV